MGIIHYVYLLFIVLVFVALILKKEIVMPCFVGIFTIGCLVSEGILGGVYALYNALILAGSEFWPIILIISLVVSMSRSLTHVGADLAIASPMKRFMVNKEITFLVIGFIMLACSLVIWPSPAVALVGAVMLPLASKLGLNPIWIAVAMNIFGHGMGLSADFFIQGAPTITAKSANVETIEVIKASVPIWIVMSAVTLIVAFVMMRRDVRRDAKKVKEVEVFHREQRISVKAKVLACFTIAIFIVDLFLLVSLKLTGGDATALIGGSVIIISIVCVFASYKPKEALDVCVDNLKEGFTFGIKVFAPVIVIGGFFFIGNEEMAAKIFGGREISILNDISYALYSKVGLNSVTAILTQATVAITAGLDGSGFSGLPIVGTLAYSFASNMEINVAQLAAFGQIVTIWIGGGTVIPWAVVPVAAICKVSPNELARRNLVPVLAGLGATTIYMILTL